MDSVDKLLQYKQQFLDYMVKERKTCTTWLHHQDTYLKRFYSFMAANQIDDLNRVTKDLLIQFQLYLYSEYLFAKDTIRCCLITLRSFFTYLYLNNLILSNPTIDLGLIPSPKPHITKGRRRYTWEELLTRIKRDHHRRGRTFLSLKQKLFGINLFIKFLDAQGVKTIYKIEPIHLEKYKEYLNNYYGTINSREHMFMKALRLKQACRFLKFFYYKGYIKTDPSGSIDYSQYRKEIERTNSCPANQPIAKPKTKLEMLVERYLTHRISLGYHPRFKTTLNPFKEFCSLRGIDDPGLVTKQNILEYQNWLPTRKYRGSKEYKQNTILNFLCSVIGFYQFLVKYDLVQFNPTVAIDLPKEQNPLPRTVMTSREVRILLDIPDTSSILGIRDKAILEVLYSTGMRANEISYLQPEDIDFSQGLVKVTHPKGGPSFQRIVAIGTCACEWVKKYIASVRPILLERGEKRSPYLFLSNKGNRIHSEGYNLITKQYVFKTGLRKKITTHSWRVTCGTVMLKNGADIRYVQEQLGHHSIRSTQRYTRLIPKDLKRAHLKYHPCELEQKKKAVQNTLPDEQAGAILKQALL